jgi:hypothetical protein
MNELELTIITNARTALENVKNFYQRDVGADRDDYFKNLYALHALTKLAAEASGMSSDCVKALHEMEMEHGAAFGAAVVENPTAMAAIQSVIV